MISTTVPVLHPIILAPKLARRAYTSVQLSKPSIDLKTWINYVRACAKVRSGAGGLVAMVGERACVHGLFAWSLLPDVSHRNALRISDIILADVPGHKLAEIVIMAIRDLAKANDAGIVLILAVKQIGTLCRDAALDCGIYPRR
jgi:hypothetical protein